MKVKLKGTITEEKIKEEICSLTKALLDSKDGQKIMELIEKNLGIINSFYVINWIPGQGDNRYTIIVNGKWYIVIELDEDENEPLEFSIRKLENLPIGLYTLIVQELIKEGTLINI